MPPLNISMWYYSTFAGRLEAFFPESGALQFAGESATLGSKEYPHKGASGPGAVAASRPVGKTGAKPARSRRCMRRGLPSGVSQGPLPPCHCPPLGAEKAKRTGASQKACFCVFPCSSAWKRTGPGPPGSPLRYRFLRALLGPGVFGPCRETLCGVVG